MKLRNILAVGLILMLVVLDHFFGSGGAGGAILGTAAGCCGDLKQPEEGECEDVNAGMECNAWIACPDDLEVIPEKAKDPDCATIQEDIVLADGKSWNTWNFDGESAVLASTENADGTFNTTVTLFFPGITSARKCLLATRKSRYISGIFPDCDGNLHFVHNAKRQTNMNTGSKGGGGDQQVGFAVTYTLNNASIPCNYEGTIL